MRHIFNYFNLNQLYKFASKEGFISRLRAIGARDEIISYVEGLEESLCGVVVGAVNKNKDISLDQLKELVAKKERMEQLKKETAKEIEEDIAIEDERIKSWIIPQIKKDKKNRSLFLGNFNKINKFLSENDIDLATYDLKSLLDYIDQIENFGSMSRGGQNLVNQFLTKAMNHLNQKLLGIGNPPLVSWAKRKAIVICKEWEKQIRRAMVEKPFEQLIMEAHKMKEDIDNGAYRGKELPDTPLRNGEYDSLVSNIEFLDDWHQSTFSDLKEYSIDRAISASNEWHRKMANSGKGLQYEKINRSNIVFGPDGWNDEENNGHLILELKSENDLKVEGAKMKHCVGGYGEKIKKGECRVFSLRHISNVYQPILTIETDSSGGIVRQDYGIGNGKIDKKYHDMVTEWSSKNEIDYSKLSYSDVVRIKDPNTLIKIVESNAKENTIQAVASSPYVTPEVLSKIIDTNPAESVLIVILEKNVATTEVLSKIVDINRSVHILNLLIRNRNITPEIINKIIDINSSNKDIIKAIVTKCFILTPEILNRIIDIDPSDQDILCGIAYGNAGRTPEILNRIIDINQSEKVLNTIANNYIATPEILNRVVDINTSEKVLNTIANNYRATPEILNRIIDINPSEDILISISKSDNLEILNRVIDINTSEKILLSILDRNLEELNQIKDLKIINKIIDTNPGENVLSKILEKNHLLNINLLRKIFEIHPNKSKASYLIAVSIMKNHFETFLLEENEDFLLNIINNIPIGTSHEFFVQEFLTTISRKIENGNMLLAIANKIDFKEYGLYTISFIDDLFARGKITNNIGQLIVDKLNQIYHSSESFEDSNKRAFLRFLNKIKLSKEITDLGLKNSIEELQEVLSRKTANFLIEIIYKRSCRFEKNSLDILKLN